MKVLEKNKAIKLRKAGKSINEIVSILKVSKASVSFWVRDVILSDKHKTRITALGRSVASIEKRRLSRLSNRLAQDSVIVEEAKKDIKYISKDELKLIGIILYMGEGGKTRRGIARVANSDPSVIQIAMRFFREICLVPESKFRGHIHTFSNANIKETEKYWSKVTGIPVKQFFKTYTKQSTASKFKRKTTPYGTIDVCVSDTKLLLKILAWIEKIKEILIH